MFDLCTGRMDALRLGIPYSNAVSRPTPDADIGMYEPGNERELVFAARGPGNDASDSGQQERRNSGTIYTNKAMSLVGLEFRRE